MRTNESGLFPALEAVLKASTEPFTCQELYDLPEIQKHAASVNRVSDYLGGLWRKGLVVRLPAPKSDNSRARWMYQWKGSRGPKLRGGSTTVPEGIEYTPRVLADRPSILITEEGSTITMELPNLIVVIKTKP